MPTKLSHSERVDSKLNTLKNIEAKIFKPKIGSNVWIHPSAQVIGRVTLREHSSIWPGCVLRGDINEIVIGRYSNIQDLSCVHLESYRGCYVGDYCVVGHQVTLHGCTLKNGVLVGMGAVIMNGVVVGDGALIGARSLVTEGMKLKPESLYLGTPARLIRKLTKTEVKNQLQWAEKYAKLAMLHAKGHFRNS